MQGFRANSLNSIFDWLKNGHMRRNDLPIRGLRMYCWTHGELSQDVVHVDGGIHVRFSHFVGLIIRVPQLVS